MNLQKFRFIILFSVQLIFSCNSNEKTSEEYLSNQILILTSSLDECYQKVIILPGTGCNGCITVAEDFFKKNYENTNILFILTNIHSLKTLNHKIGIDATKLTNVFLDGENKFSQYHNPIYPVKLLLDCKENVVTEVKFQKPGTNALE